MNQKLLTNCNSRKRLMFPHRVNLSVCVKGYEICSNANNTQPKMDQILPYFTNNGQTVMIITSQRLY